MKHSNNISVYHFNDNLRRDISFFDGDELVDYVLSNWNDFSHVADVKVRPMRLSRALDTVFKDTNHIDDNWLNNQSVTPLVDIARSSSVGDVFVYQNAKYVVAPAGFINIITKERL